MPVFPRYLAILLFGLFRAEPALGADAIEHAAIPGFSLALPALFGVLERPR